MSNSHNPSIDFDQLSTEIKHTAQQLGFQACGISSIELDQAEQSLMSWLDKGLHGEMAYMQHHGSKRSRPADLVSGTARVISVRMDYLPESMQDCEQALDQSTLGYVSRYALGRDYHKLIRHRLQQLADSISQQVGAFGYRAFCDSAPVMEKPLANLAGLGWIGKHTNLIDKQSGSWFFLGELYTDLPLPIDTAASDHCGSCQACIDICPTRAIIAPYQLDARLCISYLTIEYPGSIPVELRTSLGNRIYGCDDCQLCCPWNKFASITTQADFVPRDPVFNQPLTKLFAWDEEQFLKLTEGSAIRRIGHERWLRNIAVALGNAPSSTAITDALATRLNHRSELVREHVQWALDQHSVR